MASLRKRAAVSKLDNSLETLPEGIWPELNTGRSAGKLGLFYHLGQFHTGEAHARPVTSGEVDASKYYWNVASGAGRRVAIIDQPYTIGFRGLNGVQVMEWGLHDRNFAMASQPPELIEALRARHGDHMLVSCDTMHGGTVHGYLQLLGALIQDAQRKTALILDVMAREEWDLFACTFSEAHCAGHHFWRFHDETHPKHRADIPSELRHALRTMYRQLDDAIGTVIESAGAHARVIVLASHGMGPKIGGPQLLPEVLHRLGLSAGKPWHHRIGSVMPPWVRRTIKRVLPFRIPARLQMGRDPRYQTMTGRAMAVRNNRCGAIRLNLVGREPHGSVQPGADAESLMAELRTELLSLWDPRSGEPIVKRVISASEAFGSDHHPDLPDLMVAFRTDLGFLEACASSRVGMVQVPVSLGLDPRSGDHTAESRLWAIGPGFPAATRLPDANVLDVAPTLLRLLDVDVPSWMNGHPLTDLVANQSGLRHAATVVGRGG